MPWLQVHPAYPEIDPAMEASDADLLNTIALQKDRESFSTLYARYEKRAYSLAYYLTGNHEMAKDAVQEAMLGIWLSAPTYRRHRGSVSGWIMRIVANKSIKLTRRAKDRGAHE